MKLGRPRAAISFFRILLVVLGSASIAWAAYILPVMWAQSSLGRIAGHVIASEWYKPELLAALEPELRASERIDACCPAALKSVAYIRVRLAEQALADSDSGSIDTQLSTLDDSIRRSLACSPTDAFLWVVLFWVESNRNGFRPTYLKFMQLSYALGPNEGWIGAKRNRIAFGIFEQLPTELAKTAVAEFGNLLDSGFFDDTVAIITGPGWRWRGLLLADLGS